MYFKLGTLLFTLSSKLVVAIRLLQTVFFCEHSLVCFILPFSFMRNHCNMILERHEHRQLIPSYTYYNVSIVASNHMCDNYIHVQECCG